MALSSFGSTLKNNERAFIAWMAPRGIVAAATSSTFALGLSQAGVGGGSEKLIPIAFVVIVATALIYGLSGGPVAKALHVSRTGPGGVLIIGGSRLARTIARALNDRGVIAVIWTNDHELEQAARDEGLTVYTGDPTAVGSTLPPPELDDVESALVMTGDDGLNGMMSADLGQYFGHDRVYQLAPSGGDDVDFYVRSRVLFDDSATHDQLEARLGQGAVVDGLKVDSEHRPAVDDGAIAMFVLTPDALHIVVAGEGAEPGPGDELIRLAAPQQ